MVIRGALEEASVGFICEAVDEGVGQVDGKAQALGVQSGLVEVDGAAEQCGVRVEQLDIIALALAPAVVEGFGAVVPQLFLEECQVLAGDLDVLGLVEDDASAGEGTEHESIPGAEDLVIAQGTGSL